MGLQTVCQMNKKRMHVNFSCYLLPNRTEPKLFPVEMISYEIVLIKWSSTQLRGLQPPAPFRLSLVDTAQQKMREFHASLLRSLPLILFLK